MSKCLISLLKKRKCIICHLSFGKLINNGKGEEGFQTILHKTIWPPPIFSSQNTGLIKYFHKSKQQRWLRSTLLKVRELGFQIQFYSEGLISYL